MLDLADEFEAVISALAAHGIDYAVCGGLAMAIHGTATGDGRYRSADQA